MKNKFIHTLTFLFIFSLVTSSVIAKEIFNFNVTETHDYISKFKIIIDSVCGSFINCTLPS